jgi:hypothetical protein
MNDSQPPKKPTQALPEIFADVPSPPGVLADVLLPPEQIAKNIAEHEAYRRYEQEQKAKAQAKGSETQEQ